MIIDVKYLVLTLLAALCVVAYPKPADFIETLDSPLDLNNSGSSSDPLSTMETNPKLYLIVAEALDDVKENDNREIVTADDAASVDDRADFFKIEKRSAEDKEDDLETAAGTNVLRPLFVYRQQLAYRERIKGAVRRAGIRPRF